MKKILNDIKLFPGQPESELARIAGKKCRLSSPCVRILKKSLDARDKNNIRFVYSIEVSDRPERPEKRQLSRLPASRRPENPVLVVGSGPAGLFCAIRLLDRGVPVTLIERGPCVEERARKIAAFSAGGGLDPEGNVQFGEGGAGTFSDGKLNTGTHGGFNKEVLETFASFGAPEEILWLKQAAHRQRQSEKSGRPHAGIYRKPRGQGCVQRQTDGCRPAGREDRCGGDFGGKERGKEGNSRLRARARRGAQRAGYLRNAAFPRRRHGTQGFCRRGAHRTPAIGDRQGAVRGGILSSAARRL